MDEILKIALPGASGRMGQAIAREAATMRDARIVAATDRPDSPHINMDLGIIIGGPMARMNNVNISGNANDLIAAKPDVIIDFTTAEASVAHAELAADAGIPILIGATGHNKTQVKKLKSCAKEIPLLLCANASIGVNMLALLVERAARVFNDTWDLEITETHHRHKVDAPSGTALALGRAAAKGRGVDLEKVAVYARHGITGARKKGSIGFAAMRGGDVVGEHRVIFYGDGDEIELRHRATDRGIYAKGALVLGYEITKRDAGFYETAEILEGINVAGK